MSTRPLAFDICTPDDGGQPWLRIRSAGNRAVLLTSETYDDAQSASHVVHLLTSALASGRYEVRHVTEHRADVEGGRDE